jgi:hypothetical protein
MASIQYIDLSMHGKVLLNMHYVHVNLYMHVVKEVVYVNTIWTGLIDSGNK